MSDWFSFWNPVQSEQAKADASSTLTGSLIQSKTLKAREKKLLLGESIIEAGEGVSGLINIWDLGQGKPLYKRERDNAKKAIENQVLAGQEEILRNLSYNTDQALTYAARGNVSIGAPVMRERMKKGAEEAGFDFAMLRSNADIQKINADITYQAKRRATFKKAIAGVNKALLTYGALYGGSASLWGNTGAAYGLESTIGVNGVPLYGGSMD